jgi:hypothetical protein
MTTAPHASWSVKKASCVAGPTGTAAKRPATSPTIKKENPTGMSPAKSKRSAVVNGRAGDLSGAGGAAGASNGSDPAASIGGALLTAPTHSSSIFFRHAPACMHVTGSTVTAEAGSSSTVPPDHGTHLFFRTRNRLTAAHTSAPLSFAAHAASLATSGFVCT